MNFYRLDRPLTPGRSRGRAGPSWCWSSPDESGALDIANVIYRHPPIGKAVARALSRAERLLIVGVIIPVSLIAGAIITEVAEPQGHTLASSPHLYLTVGFNFTTGEDQYFPANFSIPVDVPVVISITNYDDGANPVPDSVGKVTGTVDGTAIVNGEAIRSMSGENVSHTFTIPALGVNVPLPALSTVTFTLLVEQAGVYEWHCMAPCDANAMVTPGFMRGTLSAT
jgi:hypothetical protein